jgi:hypothetical protein
MDEKDRSGYRRAWQQIKNDPELREAERQRLRDWAEAHRERERERSRKKYAANKEAHKVRMQKWWALHPEKAKEYYARKRKLHLDRERATDRRWAANNPDKVRAKEHRRRFGPNREQYLKLLRYAPHKHYLSRDKYEEIYPQLAEGPCEICGVKAKMHIDHCHKRNVFRGILCDGCNRGIGFFKENVAALRKAAEYLERQV